MMRASRSTSRILPSISSFHWPSVDAFLARRGLLPEIVRRLRAGAGGELLGQVVGQRDELFVLGDRRRFDLQLDHRADRRIEARVDGDPAFLGACDPARIAMILMPVFAKRVAWPASKSPPASCKRLLAVHHREAAFRRAAS